MKIESAGESNDSNQPITDSEFIERLRRRKLVNSCVKLRSRVEDPDPEFLLSSDFLLASARKAS